jgi:hypothetical protein
MGVCSSMFAGFTEQSVSANIFKGGFCCFGCSSTYKVPSPDGGLDAYNDDDFDSLKAETQRSDDFIYHITDIDWTALCIESFRHNLCADESPTAAGGFASFVP